MSKIEVIQDLKKLFQQLMKSMELLDEKMSLMKELIANEIVISEEIIQELQERLEEVRKCKSEFSSLYETLEIGALPTKWGEVSFILEKCQYRIEETTRYMEAVEFFKELHSQDEIVEQLLVNKKKQLCELDLEQMEVEEFKKNLECYIWFFQAFYETDPRKKFSFIYKLVPYFEEEIAMELQFNMLTVKTQVVAESIHTEEIIEEVTEDVVEDVAITLQKEDEIAVDPKDVWKAIGIENVEDMIVKEDDSLLQCKESEKASSKFSVKEFKKDIQKQACLHKIDCLMFGITTSGYSLRQIDVIRGTQGQYNLATDKLFQMGYIKRYIVDGYGDFYTLSSRGIHIFKSKDAIAFINSYLPKKENLYYDSKNKEEVKDTTNAAIARVLCYDSYSKFNRMRPDYVYTDKPIELQLGADWFVVEWLEAFNQEKAIFVGITSESVKEFESFYNTLKRLYDDKTQFIVVSINLELAKKTAEWIAKVMESKVSPWYYSYFDEKVYDVHTNELVQSLEKEEIKEEPIDMKPEQVVEEPVIEEPITEEPITEEPVIEEVPTNINLNIKEILESKDTFQATEEEKEIVSSTLKELDEEIVHSDLVNNIMSNLEVSDQLDMQKDNINDCEQENDDEIYQKMLASKQFHCATAYVKALSKTIPQYESIYRQLAYAVNDPMEACTYNSVSIQDVYYNAENQLTGHYVIAATIRNYFLDQFSYDYSVKQLHSMISGNSVLMNHPELDQIVYTLMSFKADYYVGIDKYADYREKGRDSWDMQLKEIRNEAMVIYNNYILGRVKETIFNRRFVEMLKIVFSPKEELAQYLTVVKDNDIEMFEMLKEFLREHYIKDQAEICEENIDLEKVNREIQVYWERSKGRMDSVKETSNLMSELRTNIFKKLYKVVAVLANYVSLIEITMTHKDDAVLHAYKRVRTSLLDSIEKAVKKLEEEEQEQLEEQAGNAVLVMTLKELQSRLLGSYIEGSNKFFYIDFLKGERVLLDDNFIPVLNEVLELPSLSITKRIVQHCKDEKMTWEERLQSIFRGEDDYGSAELILQYLHHQKIKLENVDMEDFKVEKAIGYAQKDSEIKRSNFIEELEFAQSYGKIDTTIENTKEMMIQIMDAWYEWANQTMNYGFFVKILEAFYDKIEKDAQVRAVALGRNLKTYLEQNPNWNESALICKAVSQIQERIQQQNYTAAEDLMNRLVNEDLEVYVDTHQKDYLEEFLDEYDMNYRYVAGSSAVLKNLMQTNKINKDIKGAIRLIENWPKGSGVRLDIMRNFLNALGFDTEVVVSETPIQGKMDCFFVQLKRPENGRKSNYKHPIAAFGSEAEEIGFRIVCVFGKTDAYRLIDTFKEIGNAKNTVVLLDYALPLADRRTLARKTKTNLAGKIFAVMDRVVLMYLAKHYVDTAVNRMLMSVIMPFASYQPYIDKSADVMPQELFIGRKNELEQIESATGVNIVYGGRQLGKTALLRMAQKNIDKDENGDRAVLVSVWGKDYRQAAKAVSEELRREKILKDVEITDDWSQLASNIKDRLCEEEDKIPYLLLMIDEADAFIESCEAIGYQPFEALKDIQGIGSKRFKFVVAGLRNIVRFKKEAALGNNRGLTHLKSLTVKPFKTMEARELLEVPLSYLGFRFPKDNETEVLISTIFGTTNYFPGLIQLYCTKLIEAMKRDYAGYSESETPPYIVQKQHIKKVLAEQTLQQDIREKFFITLKVGNDDYYYIIALLVAYRYQGNQEQNSCSAKDLLELAKTYDIEKLSNMQEEQIWALMEEMCELNVLQCIGEGRYRFTRYSFCQMMGNKQQIEDELLKYMGD